MVDDQAAVEAFAKANPKDPSVRELSRLLAQKEVIERRARHRTDIAAFTSERLKILTKKGELAALALNSAQLEVHQKIEAQRAKTGKVRAIILKGRKLGISTYVGARYYHKLVHETNKKTYILAHEQAASDTLFEMVSTYYENDTDKPSSGAHSAKEMWFDKLNNRYEVSTAGTKDTGRSATAQYAHLSEFAFWDNAEGHMAGLGQVIPDTEGTEIIIESTARGFGNMFYTMWADAVAGKSDYIAIFLPWFMDADNRRPPDAAFVLDAEEKKYAETYKLDPEQMAWRRAKIASDFSRNPELFKQEFPANPTEAFSASVSGALILPEAVLAAQKRPATRKGKLKLGVDSAGDSEIADRTAFVLRDDAAVHYIKYEKKLNTMQIVGRIVELQKSFPKITDICIDTIGLGKGVYDRCMELEDLKPLARSVKVSTKAFNTEDFANLRVELAVAVRDWLDTASIPDDQGLFTDLTSLRLDPPDSKGRLVLESKDDAKSRGVHSPDGFDALGVTFFGEMVTAFVAEGGWVPWKQEKPPELEQLVRAVAMEFDEMGGEWAVTKWGIFRQSDKGACAILLECTCGAGSLGDLIRQERTAYGLIDDKGKPVKGEPAHAPDRMLIARVARRDDIYRQLFKAKLSPRRIRYDSAVGPQMSGEIIASGRAYLPQRKWALQVQADVARFPQGERPLVAHSVALALTWMRNAGDVMEDEDADPETENRDFRSPYG